MKIAAFVPMKGNSERVPNKNMKDFNGRPLYHVIINTLLKSKFITDIVIDTDSEIIMNDVKKNFSTIKTLLRPVELRGDFVSMNKIIKHDMQEIHADYYMQTHSTNPLLKIETLDFAIEKFIKAKGEFDSLFSVTRVQTRFYDQNGKPYNHNPEELIRTQDLEPLFEENSNFFIFTKDSFEKSQDRRIGKKPMMFEMDKMEAVDIDEPQDFEIAKALEKIISK
jgi:CMP-N-acetylneuraminic acid synthetase